MHKPYLWGCILIPCGCYHNMCIACTHYDAHSYAHLNISDSWTNEGEVSWDKKTLQVKTECEAANVPS